MSFEIKIALVCFAILSVFVLFFAHQIGWKKGGSAIGSALLTGLLSTISVALAAFITGDIRVLLGWESSFSFAVFSYFIYAMRIALAVGFFSFFIGYIRYRIAPPTNRNLKKVEKFLIVFLPVFPSVFYLAQAIIADK